MRRSAILFAGLCEGILGGVHHALGLVEVDVFYRNADVLEHFIQSLAIVAECNCAVMRIVLLDQHVSVETSHFRNSEYANAAEGLGSYRKNFAVCDVSGQLAVSCGL